MKVLIAEDDPVTRRVLTALLTSWGYAVQAVGDGLAAWDALVADGAPRLALLDWEMPGLDGVEICRRLRRAGQEPYTYVLLITGREGDRDLVDGLDAGADDYLTKPFDEPELEARLRVGRRIVGLQEELLRAREVMRHQALHDGLTGVLNRRGIMDALGAEVAAMARRSSSLAVVLADLDRFKQVNDTHGHAVGDAVLREAAARLVRAVRPYDRVGRFGGEEFLVVLPDCDLHAARAVAERMRAVVRLEPVAAGGLVVPVSCSFGVAAISDEAPADQLVAWADAALYRAKRAGRDRVELASPVATLLTA